MNPSLPDHVHAQIQVLCEKGDQLRQRGDLDGAVLMYREAWELIPEDWNKWEASTWILMSAGEIYFQKGSFDKALDCIERAVQCPNGLGNPYVHLRLGQLRLELGESQLAADELTRAYMGAGLDIFANEDPKYLEFLKTKIRMPG